MLCQLEAQVSLTGFRTNKRYAILLEFLGDLKIVFRSCLSKARSKAVQFIHKRLYSVFNIARTTYTNRYVLIIWKHLFKASHF